MKWVTSLALVLVPTVAAAHIHMTSPKSRTDLPTGDQKTEHCGVAGYNRAMHLDRVSTFAPGATINVVWAETIQHPGYFRIAFLQDGEVFPIPPPGAGGGFPTQNLTGMTEPVTGALILADQIADGTLSTTVTLPNVECTNCTLQFIQVMTDKAPYTIDAMSDDIYFNCADLVLSNSAPDAGTGPGGEPTPGGPDAGTGNPNNGGTVDGGCSAGGDASLLALALGGAFAIRRRRRR